MIPYSFRYHRPRNLPEAQALFAQRSDARYLAGGQTLIPTMKQRLANPSDLIDLSSLEELKFIRAEGAAIIVGAGTTHCEVSESALVRAKIPALAVLAESIGDPAVRHCGTLGGSLANSDPAADWPAAVLGLGASLRSDRRSIAADDYFLGLFETALEPGEILTSVTFPVPDCAGYAKFRNPASGYAIAGVFVARFENAIRVSVTGAGPCAFRHSEMEDALSRRFAPEAVAEIELSPDGLNSDLHASAQYRAHLVSVMAKRAIAAALAGGNVNLR